MTKINAAHFAGEADVEGTPFGRYRLLELLGRGGMGEVWRAHDTNINRVVAVKVLPEKLADDPQFEQRFRREASAASLAIRQAGANIKVVQNLLGHKSATMTLDRYGHLYPDDLDATVSRK